MHRKRINLIGLLAALLACWSLAGAAQNVLMTDLVGTPIGRLPCMNRGDARLVPLAMLAKSAGFTVEAVRGKEHVTSPSCLTIFEIGNGFAEVNESFVQLSSSVESWDGSLWLPLANLDELFPTTVELSEGGDIIRLLGIADSSGGPVTLLENEEPAKQRGVWQFGKVILDAGHGGKDPGGRGPDGMVEKDVVLDIVRRAEQSLTALGIPVVLTRRSDQFLTLGQRTRLANAEAGDLFVSVHCNSYEDPTIGGAECYILKPARSERAVAVAAKENQVVELERDAEQYEALTEENFILLSMATSQYLNDSERWSDILLKKLTSEARLKNRGVDQAGFYVLMGASMPAILLECGYMTNPDDLLVLGTERGRQRIADAIADSIVEMKTEMEAAAR
ncbi:MAG: N-acetylmuramoyl-L-alanine amidase [Calditrichaeota bacterium]|nr:N-acetylmuramoyl-L-alanine amidase [Calditrichota bacterium]MCB9391132.1 N-acetylmuramoyl-L-alanine amidase [Calditrichota bacterium]